MKKFTWLILCVLTMVSCQEKINVITDEENATDLTRPGSEYTIPIETALADLADFMGNSGNAATKCIDSRKVASITPIKCNSALTKSLQNEIDCDNLLYIANFEEDKGYAILAADSRIESPIIAIVDEGQLSDATVYTAMEIAAAERVIIDGYPTTGDGFFTTPETGDEVFINPNTVVLYDPIVQDTYVGNFILDTDDNTGTKEECDFGTTPPEIISTALCVNYAMNQIVGFEDEHDDDIAVGGGVEPHGKHVETSKSEWVDTKVTASILSPFVNWGQFEPFNNLYPIRRTCLLFGAKRNAPAGCFPLAIAKIMALYGFPKEYTVNNYTIDWDELKFPYTSVEGEKSASHLLYALSRGCESLYFYQGTFTFPSNATSYMRWLGFNNVRTYEYNFDTVVNMIDKGCPLIIYSVPCINIFKSHSWNIDGYKIKERTVTTKTYLDNVLQDTTTRTETRKMVHCDFGWYNKNNGYYISGVFKLNDPNAEYDNNNHDKTTHYNNLIKLITYDKP